EPTNHLDLAARTALEELLGAFDGALVCVSHDRAFLDGLCTELVIVEGGKPKSFPGNYSAWREARAAADVERAAEREPPRAERKNASAAVQPRKPERKSSPAPAKTERKSAPATAPAAKTDASGRIRNPWAFEKLEKRIIELEAEIARLHESMTTEEV